MKIPKRYEDLTVEQFQKLEELKANDTLDKLDMAVLRLSILSGEHVDYIESLSPKQVYDYLLDAFFLTKPITDLACPNEIKLGGVKFRYIKDLYDYNICQEKDWKERGGGRTAPPPDVLFNKYDVGWYASTTAHNE